MTRQHRQVGPGIRLGVVVLLAALAGCTSLPPRGDLPVTVAVADTSGTQLGEAIAPLLLDRPGKTGIYALDEGKGALGARLLLARAAQRTLDVQYYIWHRDAAGALLMEEIRRAAERGVRVRLLLDDNGVAGLDEELAALDAHANIEVRLVNPFANRGARWLGYLTDFDRLNRRMHNKSFTVDGQVTIVGGRNIGNEYFEAGQDVSFADLDVLAIGPAVTEVSLAFDRYWNSPSAYAAADLLDGHETSSAGIEAAAKAVVSDPRGIAYLEALARTDVVRGLLAGSLPFDWGDATLVCDDPAKLLGHAEGPQDLALGQISQVVGEPQRDFLLVSPYFVPGKRGTDSLVAMAKRGVRVTVLTNSLAATDVTAVHAGYAKRRKDLLRGGVRLFELKPTAGTKPGSGGGAGSSGASLHAKTFAVAGERLFVGSFNFDPRSTLLNTEMGLIIRSRTLAGRLADAFATGIPLASWEAVLGPAGHLEWIERGPAGETRRDEEPEAGFFRRFNAGFVSLLPVEGLL